MVSVKEIPGDIFIEKLAKYIKKNIEEVYPLEWAYYVKTGPSRVRPPDDPDWWYIRAASILRKLYIHGPLSIKRLRSMYGGRKDRGVRPEHFYKGGGSNIRNILHQLESAGLVQKTNRGRILSPRGRSLLDKLATEIRKSMEIRPWYMEFGE